MFCDVKGSKVLSYTYLALVDGQNVWIIYREMIECD